MLTHVSLTGRRMAGYKLANASLRHAMSLTEDQKRFVNETISACRVEVDDRTFRSAVERAMFAADLMGYAHSR